MCVHLPCQPDVSEAQSPCVSPEKAFSQRTNQMLPGNWLVLILDMYHVCSDTIMYLLLEISFAESRKSTGISPASWPLL